MTIKPKIDNNKDSLGEEVKKDTTNTIQELSFSIISL